MMHQTLAPRSSPGPAVSADLIQSLRNRHLIGGALVEREATFDVINPATLGLIGTAAAGDATDVDMAVRAALASQPSWAGIAARERGRLVLKGAEALQGAAGALATLLALETGRAIRTECRPEIAVAIDILRFYGGLGSELKGETLPFREDMLSITTREPLGVVAAILPWNVPLVLMMLKIGPALVAGNTVVVKSAEEAPFATLEAARLLAELLPAGVLNVLSGDGESCGAPLVAHPKVAKVTFTGSQEAGEAVYRSAAAKIIPVSLELGGKSAMVVFDDADLDKAVAGAVAGMRFTRQGQSCTASSRIYVHSSLFDDFVEKLSSAVDALQIGDPLDEATDIGTIISETQRMRVEQFIRKGEATPGTTAIRCCRLPDAPHLAGGLFLQPVIFTGLPENSSLMREEIFGPVVCVQAWDEYEDVLHMANDSDFGLAATVWTNDLRKALDATRRLDAGYVQVNQNLTIQPNLSYGGFKKSGLGKEASLEAMLEHFTRKKTIVFNMQ
jgi:betaine-aldehyde dehydrogenase